MAAEFDERLQLLKKLVTEIGRSADPIATRLIEDAVQLAEDALADRTRALALANTDPGTQLQNKRYFESRMDAVWSAATRNQRSVGLAIVDIDHFKNHNTRYGHAHADETLRDVAQAIAATLTRETDVACRWGGEEFAVVLPDCDDAGVKHVGELIRAAVADLGIEHHGSPTAEWVTVSVGTSACIPRPGTPPTLIFEAADKALQRAKDTGRDRVVHASPTINLDQNFARDGAQYTGRILRADEVTVTQEIGRGREIHHPAGALETVPAVGDVVTLRYSGGRAALFERSAARELERS